jgi:hypothetical protein
MKIKEHMSILIFNFSIQLILGEEVALSKLTLMEVTSKICDGVQARAELGIYILFIIVFEDFYGSVYCFCGKSSIARGYFWKWENSENNYNNYN